MKTNYDAIAIGWLELLPEMEIEKGEHTLPLKIGMLPKVPFEMLMNNYFKAVAEKMVNEGPLFSGCDPQWVVDNLTKEYKNKEEKEMANAIYRNAKMVV